MSNSKLSLHNFRCFESLTFEFQPGITWIEGNNASGKTSILEAVYLLTRARSFRTTIRHEIISKSKDQTIARLEFGKGQSLAAKITQKDVVFKAKQQEVRKTSELSKALSVQFIGPHAHTLITGEPLLRRAFIDWGLFHVEPSYLLLWKMYAKALKQRNAGLAAAVSDSVLESLDLQLILNGEKVTEARLAYIADLNKRYQRTLCQLTSITTSELSYRKGWSKELTFSDALSKARETDRQRRFTAVGPHRADLQVYMDSSPAKKFGSNGQQKMFAISLILAQQASVTNSSKLLLIDDLVAELDQHHSTALLRFLKDQDLNAIITSTSLPQALSPLVDKQFHVEHGMIKSVVE